MTEQMFVSTDGSHWLECDLDPKASVKQEWRSNVGGKVTDTVLSRTSTVRLPKTQRNDGIFEMAGRPPYTGAGEIPWRMFPCRWVSGGVTVIDGGMAYLTGVTHTYDVSIVWGSDPAFLAWAKADPKLSAVHDATIPWTSAAGVTEWGHGSTPSEIHSSWDSMFYATYDRGFTDGTQIHPCVTLYELLHRIMAASGIGIEVDDASAVYDMQRKCLLLTPADDVVVTDAVVTDSDPSVSQYGVEWTLFMAGIPKDHQWHQSMSVNSHANRLRFVAEPGLSLGGPWFNAVSTYNDLPSYVILHVIVGDVAPGVVLYDHAIRCDKVSGDSGQSWYEIPEQTVDMTYESSEGDNLFEMTVEFPSGTPQMMKWDSGSIEYHYQVRREGYPDVDTFHLCPNLPDMTQMEFVRALCMMYGLFMRYDGDHMHLSKFARIVTSAGVDYADWTRKLVSSETDDADCISFTAGLARHNRIAYTDDQGDIFGVQHQESYIESHGAASADDADLFVFPWAASYGDRVIQYHAEGGTAKFTKLVHRIMSNAYDPGTSGNSISFTSDLTAASIAARWGLWQRTVYDPKVIKAKVMLNPYDLQELDSSRPVYLGQYGRYYAIVSVSRTTGGDLCEAELMQLPIYNGY